MATSIGTRRWSLATHLTAYFAVTAFLLVAAAAYLQYRTLVTSLAAEDDRLLREWLVVAPEIRPEALPALLGQKARGPVVRALSAGCEPLGEWAAAGEAVPPPRCDVRSGEAPLFRTWRSPDGHQWRIASRRTETGWVEALLDRESDAVVLRAFRQDIVFVLGAALLAATGLGLTIARRGLKPLDRLSRRVATIDARSLGRRLAGGNEPAEIRALVTSFDGMLDRLDRAFRSLTEFSADLAHELRTPIHVLRQQAEVALQRARTPDEYREILGSSLEELERMRRMVDDILFLARAEDPRAVVQRSRLSLANEIRDVADFLQASTAEREVSVICNVPTTLELSADRTLVRRALVNVVTNALRHTPAGGRIDLSAREEAGERGGTVVIEISDSGSGIPVKFLPHVFERHVRGPDASARHPDGAGLGLAIVRGVMTLHGGTAVMSSVPDEGSRVTLTFPKTPIDAQQTA